MRPPADGRWEVTWPDDTFRRGHHESSELMCQHAEALIIQNASHDTLRTVQAAIVSLLQYTADQCG